MCGPSVYKVRTNWHRNNYYETSADTKPTQCGTVVFIQELSSRSFASGAEVAIRLRGQQLNLRYLAEHGWRNPLLFDDTSGLDLVVPDADSFSVHDVENYIGSDFEVDVIDVARQRDIRMSLHHLVSYFSSSQKVEVYNCISLEFSQTSLSSLVEPPYIVRKLCWVTNLWPLTLDIPGSDRPQVSKYCLLSAAESYTDFHIDFGGTSVWYHVLKGSKVFYLIRPTPSNLALYQHWMSSKNRMSTFFGDQVDSCYQLELRAGQTLLIPSGWIHAVFTPADSIVFGGNFLCSLNAAMQLKIDELESRLLTPIRFRFPSLHTCHWLAAELMVTELMSSCSGHQLVAAQLVESARDLLAALRAWHRQQTTVRGGSSSIPSDISPARVIRQLSKAIRSAEKTGTVRTAAQQSPTAASSITQTDASCVRQLRRSVRPKRLMDDEFIDISESHRFESLLVEAEQSRASGNKKRSDQLDKTAAAGGKKRVQTGMAAGNQKKMARGSGGRRLVISEKLTGSRSVSKEEPLKLRLSLDSRGQRVSRLSSLSDTVDSPSTSPSELPSHERSDLPGDNSSYRDRIDSLLMASSVKITKTTPADVSPPSSISSSSSPPPHLPSSPSHFSSRQPPASPTTRDAIDGMLCMSQSVPLASAASTSRGPAVPSMQRLPTATGATSISRKQQQQQQRRRLARRNRRRRSLALSEDDEAYGTAQDDDFVYPSLHSSDDDDDDDVMTGVLFGRPRVSTASAGGDGSYRTGREADQLWLPKSSPHSARRDSMGSVRHSSEDNSNKFNMSGHDRNPSLPKKVSKPKKGMATVKQRLGKILKMHKMKF